MSKSTPISNLPNLKKQGEPAFEQRENDIVKEILNEIDSSGKGGNSGAQQAQQAHAQEQVRQQMMEQQMMEQQMMEQQMMEQQMMEQPSPDLQQLAPPSLDSMVAPKPKSLVENILANLKPSLIVAVIVMLLSVPAISNALTKILSSKVSLAKIAMPLTLAIKGAMGGALFYAANNSIPM